ncbi:MAG: monovalent cation/H+ antiporter subunit D [Beijerinckiaceae bacterium]|nr:monovalent cation/H+ antiporter subunit D [Beijerinckiaceae bacterium]
MSSAWIIAPILLPAIAAPLLILLRRHDLTIRRAVSVGACALLLAVAIGLYGLASDGVPRAYLLGAWKAPFGIVLVLDRLSATMVLLTAALAFFVSIYSCNGWDRRGKHFHSLFQFQLMGINGAFLTGDVFNLFVFFEVMLIASYGLLLHAGGKRRITAGFQYVTVNLIGSALFLVAVSLMYNVTGTLNIADLALKTQSVAPESAALLKVAALLLFVVFAIKAALAPLHWWLPTAYSAASAPAAAVFAVMTKVGAYCIIRVYTLAFGPDAGPVANIVEPWIMPAALVTLAIGAIGAISSRSLAGLIVFAVVWSTGSLLVVFGSFDQRSLAAALYYAVHSTFAAATLFLVADLVASQRAAGGELKPSPPIAQAPMLGAVFFLAAIAMAGMPPLSGFIGKLLILDATRNAPGAVWIWSALLVTSLVVIAAFARAGSLVFWRSEEEGPGLATAAAPPGERADKAPLGGLVAACALLAMTALMAAFAGPVTQQMDRTAAQILDRAGYVRAVLGPEAPVKFARIPGER